MDYNAIKWIVETVLMQYGKWLNPSQITQIVSDRGLVAYRITYPSGYSRRYYFVV